MLCRTLYLLFYLACSLVNAQVDTTGPVRLAVAGLSHGHAGWLRQLDTLGEYVELVGIAESDTALVNRMADYLDFPQERIYPTLSALLAAEEVEAVAAFGSTYEHLAVVEECAPRGVHVMVEKPLAVDVPTAERMAALARRHGIHLLTNYETNWMPGVVHTAELARAGELGELRHLVFRTGHMGPAKIGLSEQFLEWLTDPVLNGGGALMDFGCYGANMATYLMGAAPDTVIRQVQQTQPELYPPGVEDVATLILRYPETEVIIQAAWNWPHHVKDMDVHGTEGYALNFHRDSLEVRTEIGTAGEVQRRLAAPGLAPEWASPFRYFAEVVRGRVVVERYGVYGLENNLEVIRILMGG